MARILLCGSGMRDVLMGIDTVEGVRICRWD